jgi:Uma2 family endonuclease
LGLLRGGGRELVWLAGPVNGMMGTNDSPSREEGMSTVKQPARQVDAPAVAAHPLTLVTNDWTLEIPPTAFTMEGFREWATADDFPERVKVTFLQGEIFIDMSTEDMEDHVNPKTEITTALVVLCKQLKIGKVYGDGLLLTNSDAEVSNNPDALFFSYKTFEARQVRRVPRSGAESKYGELEGTPDWVLEVVSDSSVKKDLVRLRAAYHRAGISEYWIVDARGEELSFQVLLRRKNGYVAAPSADGWLRSKVFGRSFRLERKLDDLGLWDYTLHVREE